MISNNLERDKTNRQKSQLLKIKKVQPGTTKYRKKLSYIPAQRHDCFLAKLMMALIIIPSQY